MRIIRHVTLVRRLGKRAKQNKFLRMTERHEGGKDEPIRIVSFLGVGLERGLIE